jgi:hypothetical protein
LTLGKLLYDLAHEMNGKVAAVPIEQADAQTILVVYIKLDVHPFREHYKNDKKNPTDIGYTP